MKGYIKYIALFIILVLVGVVSINFYNTSRLDTNEKTEEKNKSKKDTKTEESKEVTNQETNESENNKEKSEENNIDTTKNTTEENNTSTNQNTTSNSASNTEQTNSNNDSSQNNTNSSSTKETTTSTQSGTSKETNSNTPESYNVIDVTDYTTTTSSATTYSNSNNTAIQKSNATTKSTTSSTKEEYNEIEIDNSKSNTATSSPSTNNNNQTATNPTTNNNPSSNSQPASNSTNTEEKNLASIGTIAGASEKPVDTTTSTDAPKNNSSTKTTIEDGNIIGATGYTALNSKKYLRTKPSNNSTAIVVLKAGVPFKILDKNSKDTWWKVSYNGKTGYVENAYCLINLPDYIPSITYKITNADKNISKSSGVKLSVYGKKLYAAGKVYNERLEKEEYIVPVVYSFAKKILTAQKAALKDGYSLKIYDAYRPTSVANELRDSLATLYNSNSTVRKNINYSYDAKGNQYTWGQGWFIAQNLSAHSLAAAIDVSLTKKGQTESLKMPSSMDELSTKSIKYTYGVSGQTTVRTDLYSSTMTPAAKKLDAYMMNAGLTSLASEWWHFQDNTAYNRIKSYEPQGLNFQPTKVVSSK